MAVGTGAALLGSALIGGGLGYMGSRDQRRAAEAAARNASQPQYWTQYQRANPQLQSILDTILADAFGGYGTALPSFPSFESYLPSIGGYSPLATPQIHSYDYQPLPTPNIPGASASSQEMLDYMLDLVRSGSPFLDVGEQAQRMLLEGTGNEFMPLAQAFVTGSPAAMLAAGGAGPNSFEERVADMLQREFQQSLEEQVAAVAGGASALGRSGGDFQATQEIRAREALSQQFADALTALRAGNYENEQQRMLEASNLIGGLTNQLAGLRSGEIQTAGQLAPALEQARFLGPDATGSLSAQLDQLAQASAMFESEFAAQQAALDAQYGRYGVLDQMWAADFAAQQAALEAQYGQAAEMFNAQAAMDNANRLNAYNMSRFQFDLGSPFMRQNQLLDTLLPIMPYYTTQGGMGQQRQYPAYTPGGFSGLFSGGLGGLMTGISLFGLPSGWGGGGGGGGGGWPYIPGRGGI